MIKLVNKIIDDYESYCRDILENEFIDYKPSKQGAIYEYHRYKYRIISTHPRKVVEANGLFIPMKFMAAYREIVKDITSGLSLKKYQSRKLKNVNYDDDMLSHWRIQHFHLGNTLDEDGFIKRTKELLFIFFTKQTAYIVGVFSHDAWCDLDVIEIIHKNWPNEILRFKRGNSEKVLTENEYKILRRKNCNATIVLRDGTEYFGPGFGVTMGGYPVEATINAHKVMINFHRDFEIISLNFNEILSAGEINKGLDGTVTIGLEMNHVDRRFVYKIYETNFRFTLEN